MSSSPQLGTLQLDRRLIAHPEAFHLKRMRIGIWLYLYLRIEADERGEILIDPATVGRQMGLKEGTIRSWLGHLRKCRT